MKKMMLLLLLLCVALPAFASNITIWDMNGTDPGAGLNGEDNETEPGMELSQNWDLEGFFFDKSNQLSVVGGFDFENGYEGIGSGDIFISTVEGGPVYGDRDRDPAGDTQQDILNTYKYNYVLDLNFSEQSYLIYEINEDTVLKTAKYDENEGSSPWQYDMYYRTSSGSNTYSNAGDSPIGYGSFEYVSNYSTDFLGMNSNETHYALTGFDLSFLGHETDFYAHFTMGVVMTI